MHNYIRFISLRKYGSTLVADAQLPPRHICHCSGGMNPPLLHTAAPNQRIETMIDVLVDQGLFCLCHRSLDSAQLLRLFKTRPPTIDSNYLTPAH
jgi:hypothetical protein